MNSSVIVEGEAVASEVAITDDELIVSLLDGHRICVPLAWYPRLLHATPTERANYELVGRGTGIHWPFIDEDLSVSGILKGNSSRESDESLKAWLEKRRTNQQQIG